jgi:hypothetical protein
MKQKNGEAFEVIVKNKIFPDVPPSKHFRLKGKPVYPPGNNFDIESGNNETFHPHEACLELKIDVPTGNPKKAKYLVCTTEYDFIIFKRKEYFRLIVDLKGVAGFPTNVEVGVRE